VARREGGGPARRPGRAAPGDEAPPAASAGRRSPPPRATKPEQEARAPPCFLLRGPGRAVLHCTHRARDAPAQLSLQAGARPSPRVCPPSHGTARGGAFPPNSPSWQALPSRHAHRRALGGREPSLHSAYFSGAAPPNNPSGPLPPLAGETRVNAPSAQAPQLLAPTASAAAVLSPPPPRAATAAAADAAAAPAAAPAAPTR
jgi:hypothetical protein